MSDQQELFVPTRYIVSKNFSHRYNGVVIAYQAGQVITDAARIQTLLDSSSPIAPILDEDDLGVCPHCGKSFSMSGQRGARELLRRASQLMPGHV